MVQRVTLFALESFSRVLDDALGMLFTKSENTDTINGVIASLLSIHALSFDMQFSAIECTALGPNLIGGKFGLQYSIGSLLPSGARFYVDLIGIGVDIMGIEFPHPFYSVKLLGFQHTTSNGFYWGLRTALSISTFVDIIEKRHIGGGQWTHTKIGTIPRTDVGFGAYLAIGYDFGKKINPKDYEPRPR